MTVLAFISVIGLLTLIQSIAKCVRWHRDGDLHGSSLQQSVAMEIAEHLHIAHQRGGLKPAAPKRLPNSTSPRAHATSAIAAKPSPDAHHAKLSTSRPAPQQPRATAESVREAVDALSAEWAAYRLDIEAWYLTKPLLRDTTGTVATTVAYTQAMTDLMLAADALTASSSQHQIDAAVSLADRAWKAWHIANDYAAAAGLGDRTPTERAALQRLSKLVVRLTRSSAADPELPMVKKEIQACLDRITTVSASWSDIASLPAIEAAGLVPALEVTPPRPHNVPSPASATALHAGLGHR